MRLQGQKAALYLLILSSLSGCGGGGGGSSTNSSASHIISSNSNENFSSSVSSQSSSSASSVVNITEWELLNFKNDETISYKLPILFGRCPAGETTLTVEVAGKTYTWPLSEGYFKGPVLLNKGSNEIRLDSNSKIVYTTLNYEPSNNAKKVQMVYAIAANDDGHYLAGAGEANDMESAKKRLVVQSLMMQSATAEMMFKSTGKHDTYTLVEDENEQPIISVFQVTQTRETLYAMDGLVIYYSIQDQLKTETQNNNKYMVTMGFSSYANGKVLGHTALGGANLALFGGLHLHTCPQTPDDIASSFSNTTLIDKSVLPDDSVDRGTYWANCATGMGASLHELGHTFGLPHTDYGIMYRGFDHFNRLFMINEPGYPFTLTRDREFDAVWHPDSLGILKYSPWIFQ